MTYSESALKYLKDNQDTLNQLIGKLPIAMLLQQELYMWSLIGQSITKNDFDWLCDRRGFNHEQRMFLVDGLKTIGLYYG